VIVHRRGAIRVFIWRPGDGESPAVAALDEQRPHLLRKHLRGGAEGRCDVGEAGLDESPPVTREVDLPLAIEISLATTAGRVEWPS
jgi:hypothetical protein